MRRDPARLAAIEISKAALTSVPRPRPASLAGPAMSFTGKTSDGVTPERGAASCLQPRDNADTQKRLEEIAMFSVTGRKFQNAVCMILSAVIVSVSLSLGAFAAERAEHSGYSVTITQVG